MENVQGTAVTGSTSANARLAGRDYVIVIDKSASMEENDCPAGKTRWETVQETTLALARKLQSYDPDGITVITFGTTHKVYENTTPDKVKQVFQENHPGGSTILAPVLEGVFKRYQDRKRAGDAKPAGEMLIVVTDGAPQDESDVAKAIVKFGNSLANGDDEYGIAFFQVGKDTAASNFLKKLDDDLGKLGAKHDIVDAKTMDDLENMSLDEALIAALDD